MWLSTTMPQYQSLSIYLLCSLWWTWDLPPEETRLPTALRAPVTLGQPSVPPSARSPCCSVHLARGSSQWWTCIACMNRLPCISELSSLLLCLECNWPDTTEYVNIKCLPGPLNNAYVYDYHLEELTYWIRLDHLIYAIFLCGDRPCLTYYKYNLLLVIARLGLVLELLGSC